MILSDLDTQGTRGATIPAQLSHCSCSSPQDPCQHWHCWLLRSDISYVQRHTNTSTETFLPCVTAKCRNSLTLCSNAKNLPTSSPAALFLNFEEKCIILQGAAPLLLPSHLLLGSLGSPVPPGAQLTAQLPVPGYWHRLEMLPMCEEILTSDE